MDANRIEQCAEELVQVEAISVTSRKKHETHWNCDQIEIFERERDQRTDK